MRDKISELMDGELEGREAQELLTRLRVEGEGRDLWRTYHLIGDAMRDSRSLSPDFALRVMGRIEREPTVLAPARLPGQGRRLGWIGLQVAAGVAAVALVGWLAIQPATSPLPIAKAPEPQPSLPAEAATVPPPAATADYLLAHQRYSPRNALQGVAPYVRTVADQPGAPRRP